MNILIYCHCLQVITRLLKRVLKNNLLVIDNSAHFYYKIHASGEFTRQQEEFSPLTPETEIIKTHL